MAKTVILLGKGSLAIKVGEWFVQSQEYDLIAVVPVLPEPAWSDSLVSWCQSRDIPIIDSGRYEDLPGFDGDDWGVDLAISVYYDRIIRPSLIDRCGKILNIHNSPLPRYRGVNPVNWALKNGESEHGVTIHHITPGIDDGPIVSQVRFGLYPEIDEVIDAYQRTLAFAYVLFEQTMPLLDRIEPAPQNEAEATYYSKKDFPNLGDRSGFTRADSNPG